jgi:protein-tyrosine phosphatase
MDYKFSILFVCTANIIRSSIASALFQKMMTEDGTINLWQIESAGTWAKAGQKVPTKVVELMKERGLDLFGHRSRLVTKEILNQFSLILTMEPGQKEALKVEFPEIADRVYMLGEMAGNYTAVADPEGRLLEEFVHTADEIEELLIHGNRKIVELAKNNKI